MQKENGLENDLENGNCIWQLVRREGKSARNLVAWSVPAVDRTGPKRGPRAKPSREKRYAALKAKPRQKKVAATSQPPHLPPLLCPALREQSPDTALSEELCVAVAGQYSQSQRGSGPPSRKADLHARYWSYLFDNLHRAVDEIYCTCEADESVVECQEVVMTLEVCRRDFEALIKRFELQKVFDNIDQTNRPASVAWEIRKTSSPGRPKMAIPEDPPRERTPTHNTRRPSPARSLDFGAEKEGGKKTNKPSLSTCTTGLTWADRVRGVSLIPNQAGSHNGAPGKREQRVSSKTERSQEPKTAKTPEGDPPPPPGTNEKPSSGTQEEGSGSLSGSWSNIVAEYEAQEGYRQTFSWADRCESPPRSPGRVIHLHQRLSSPSRKRPIEESKRIQEEKQAKAEQQRVKIQEEKTQHSRTMTMKIREVRESRDARAMQWRKEMEGRLQRAEQLRSSHLQERVRKAQEEEAKVSEIAFINTLEAQNKRIEVLERHQGHEARLQDLQEERQRRREEHQAKEEAAQERRRALEAERKARVMELEQRRKNQDAKVELRKLEMEKAREEAAREKARERVRKLEARNVALQLSAEELEKRIQMKLDEQSRRYDQQLEQKKERAAVAARHWSSEDAPRVEAYIKKKWCTLCNIKIISEVYLLSHLRGQRHQEMLSAVSVAPDSSSVIVEASEEHQAGAVSPEVQQRLQAGRKRARKLRQRMASRMREQEARSQNGAPASPSKNRAKLQKAIKEVGKQLEGPSPSPQLDRTLGEINRVLAYKSPDDQQSFRLLGGVASLLRLLLLLTDHSPGKPKKTLSERTFTLILGALQAACAGHTDNCHYFILSNKFAPIVDLTLKYLVAPEPGEPEHSALCGPLLSLLASILSTLSSSPPCPALEQPMTDCISYLVCVGTIDRLAEYFSSVTGPIEEAERTKLVLGATNMLLALTAYMHCRVENVFAERPEDPTLLTTALRQTECARLLQLLYAMLLHGGPPRHSSIPPPLSQHTLTISTAAMKVINNCAILNLPMVQSCLGAEGISLEFRHVVSYLLWFCSHNKNATLLHELILVVGYFSVLHGDNQAFLQAGRNPTLLQLLCGLPFEYFSDPQLSALLFPTLIAACYQRQESRAILQQEISPRLLTAFLQEHLLSRQQGGGGSRQSTGVPESSMFEHRFPPTHWQLALDFFS